MVELCKVLMGWAVLGLAAVGALGQTNRPAASGQTFGAPIYDPVEKNRIVGRLRGVVARIELNAQRYRQQLQPLESVRLEYYDLHGGTNLVLIGTNCVYDPARNMAWSAGPLTVFTGDGRLELQGRGFSWWRTNNEFQVSNDVQTVLRRVQGTNAGSLAGAGGSTIQITSGTLRFLYDSNWMQFAEEVHVKDASWDVMAAALSVQRSPEGQVEYLDAQREVVITNRVMEHRLTGDRARYWLEEGKERVELSGDPRWAQGARRGQADRFLMERERNRLMAIGEARMQLPAGGLGTDRAALMPFSEPPAAGAGTNRLVEVRAGMITIQLPTRPGADPGLIAQTNVVLIDPQQGGQTTADTATYDEQGVLELVGDPVWTAGERQLRAGRFRFETRLRRFTAETNVVVRLPLRAFGKTLTGMGYGPGREGLAGVSNGWVEVRSPRLGFQEPWLRWEGGVEARGFESDRRVGVLTCRSLGLKYQDYVRQVQATGSVRGVQDPVVRSNGSVSERDMECETLEVRLGAEGQVQEVAALGGVVVNWNQSASAAAAKSVRHVTCERVVARFEGETNQLEQVRAEGGVTLVQDLRRAEAGVAVYAAGEDTVTLTGHPVVTVPEGRVTDADGLVWERRTGKYRVLGASRLVLKSLPGGDRPLRLRLGPKR